MAKTNPIELFDKTKLGDHKYFNAWYTNNIGWINQNRDTDEYNLLLKNFYEAEMIL